MPLCGATARIANAVKLFTLGHLSNSLAVLLAFGFVASTQAQTTTNLPDSPGYLMLQAATQPEANQLASTSADSGAEGAADTLSSAPAVTAPVSPIYPSSHPYYHRVIKPDMGPQPLSSGQKLMLAGRSSISGMSFFSNAISSGWSHLNDSRPHYGTDKAGYGERLGAAKLKQASENFFSYGLWAAAFHEDPHYYIMGPSHSIKERAIYSATRVFITRKDSGGTGVNWAKLAGIASSNALVNAYYPDRDRGVRQSVEAYGTNLLTSAATTELNEFLPDILHLVHKKSK